jgi:hypothetical protein
MFLRNINKNNIIIQKPERYDKNIIHNQLYELLGILDKEFQINGIDYVITCGSWGHSR